MVEKSKVLSIRLPEQLAEIVRTHAKGYSISSLVKQLVNLHFAPEYYQESVKAQLQEFLEAKDTDYLDLYFLESEIEEGMSYAYASYKYLEEKQKFLKELKQKVISEVRSNNELTPP